MLHCDTLIRNVQIVDGSGGESYPADVAIAGGRILNLGSPLDYTADREVNGSGRMLAPGFIDAHTHDDLRVIEAPAMLPKLSQGVTTVVVGNCGISAAPVRLGDRSLPDPMNLLGVQEEFRYPTFAEYVQAVDAAQPAVNVAALVGHTALRNNHMDRLDRPATSDEISAMREDLHSALEHGALGMSTGLAYASAGSATTDEVLGVARVLGEAGGIYATHLRSETGQVLEALDEAYTIARTCGVPLVVSHLKCAGIDNWGMSVELLQSLTRAGEDLAVGWDCYPYAASSSTLDLRQVDERVTITITWSEPHPEAGGRTLSAIATEWGMPQVDAARRLQPAGAIYHCMDEKDVRTILRDPRTMIGSDGLPCDPRPHPRLWGTFARVLGHYGREQKILALPEAVRRMTSLPAQRFGFRDRGYVRAGYAADLVLFDSDLVRDAATFEDPVRAAEGIMGVWVGGVLSFWENAATGDRAGRFLPRTQRMENFDRKGRPGV